MIEAAKQSDLEKVGRIRGLVPAIAVMLTLVWAASFTGVAPAGPELFQFDKVAHFFVFGLMGTLWFRWLRYPFLSRKRFILALSLVVAFGVLDEVLQYFNPDRSFDPYDWIADIIGAFTGILVYLKWKRYRTLLESSIYVLVQRDSGSA